MKWFNLSFIRFDSNVASPINGSKLYQPSNLAFEHIDKGNITTSETINSVLLNQKVSISQEELDKLLKLPSVKFQLPITSETSPSLLALIAKPRSRRSNAGVYIFTHEATGNKYVGSTNDLARRFKQYFEKNTFINNKSTGLLLPLMEKEGFDAFTLEVIVIPYNYPKFSYCFLEQYYLLDKRFNLNTHKIVNFRVNQGFKIYLYDNNYKTLYYTCNSLNAFCADLGIHHSSYRKCITKGSLFLDFFIISNTLIEDAVPANLTLSELHDLLVQLRKQRLDRLGISYGKVIEVFDKETNETKIYNSSYKVSYRLGISRTTVRNYLNSDQPYKGRYYLKYSDKN